MSSIIALPQCLLGKEEQNKAKHYVIPVSIIFELKLAVMPSMEKLNKVKSFFQELGYLGHFCVKLLETKNSTVQCRRMDVTSQVTFKTQPQNNSPASLLQSLPGKPPMMHR